MSVSEIPENVSYTEYLEKYFSDTGEKAACMCWLHHEAEKLFSFRRIFIELPAIVLSGVIGFGSVGTSTIFSGQQERASMILGLMSLFVSILQTTGSFFQWSKRAESHRVSSIHYGKLNRFIAVEMKLPVQERMRAADFLKVVKDTYDRLAETSPQIPDFIVSKFKKAFSAAKYASISRPQEANGIDEIIIYKEKKNVLEVSSGASLSPSSSSASEPFGLTISIPKASAVGSAPKAPKAAPNSPAAVEADEESQ